MKKLLFLLLIPFSLYSQQNKRQEFNNKISLFISKNIDFNKIKKSGIKGKQKALCLFTIDSTGSVANISARSKFKIIEKEICNTISKLPKVKPATRKGKKVNLKFSIPILLDFK